MASDPATVFNSFSQSANCSRSGTGSSPRAHEPISSSKMANAVSLFKGNAAWGFLGDREASVSPAAQPFLWRDEHVKALGSGSGAHTRVGSHQLHSPSEVSDFMTHVEHFLVGVAWPMARAIR